MTTVIRFPTGWRRRGGRPAIHPLVNVPRELSLAAEVTAHFIGVYA